MQFVAQILAAIAVGILRFLLTRRDWMQKGQEIEFEEALKHANRALQWKAMAILTDGGGADLRVRPDASPITLPSTNSDTASDTPGPSMFDTIPDSVRGSAPR